MKPIATIAAAAALFAVPAAAQAQAFLQVEAGLDSVSAAGESKEGVAYGVTAGYDIPFGNGMFVGVQATAADSTTKECVGAPDDRLCLRTGRDLSAAARLGAQVGERSKLYVLGGYTNARLRLTYDDGFGRENIGSGNADGFRVGAGGEYNINANLFVKAEYRYSNYEGDFSRHNAILALGTKF